MLDEKELLDWDAIALDGSNVRALKAAAGAKKSTTMNSTVVGWGALEAALAPKSIWRRIAQHYR